MTVEREVRLDAVLGEEMTHLIENLGLRERFERGECTCHICKEVMNYMKLKLVFPMDDGEVGFLCNKPQCLVEFVLQR